MATINNNFNLFSKGVGTQITSDSFARSDMVIGDTDVFRGGSVLAWQECGSSGWEVDNGLYFTSDPTYYDIVYVNATSTGNFASNSTIETLINFSSSVNKEAGVVAYLNSSTGCSAGPGGTTDCIALVINPNAGSITLYTIDDGEETSRNSSSFTYDSNYYYALRLTFTGWTAKAYLDAILKTEYDNGDPLPATRTLKFSYDLSALVNELYNSTFNQSAGLYNESTATTFKEFIWHFVTTNEVSSLPLFVEGTGTYNKGMTLYINDDGMSTDNIPLFIEGKLTRTGSRSLFIEGGYLTDSIPLYIGGVATETGNIPLYVFGAFVINDNITNFVQGHESIPLFINNTPESLARTLFISGLQPTINESLPLYIASIGSTSGQDLVIWGEGQNIGWYTENLGRTLFIRGDGIDGEIPLYINGVPYIDNNISMYVLGGLQNSDSLNLSLPNVQDTKNDNLELYIHGF